MLDNIETNRQAGPDWGLQSQPSQLGRNWWKGVRTTLVRDQIERIRVLLNRSKGPPYDYSYEETSWADQWIPAVEDALHIRGTYPIEEMATLASKVAFVQVELKNIFKSFKNIFWFWSIFLNQNIDFQGRKIFRQSQSRCMSILVLSAFHVRGHDLNCFVTNRWQYLDKFYGNHSLWTRRIQRSYCVVPATWLERRGVFNIIPCDALLSRTRTDGIKEAAERGNLLPCCYAHLPHCLLRNIHLTYRTRTIKWRLLP